MFGHKPPEKMNLRGTFNSMHDCREGHHEAVREELMSLVVSSGLA